MMPRQEKKSIQSENLSQCSVTMSLCVDRLSQHSHLAQGSLGLPQVDAVLNVMAGKQEGHVSIHGANWSGLVYFGSALTV